MNITTLETDIRNHIRDVIDDLLAEEYPEDMIHEITDGFVPVYNAQLAEMLANDTSLAELDDEGLGEGVTNIFKRLQIAVYERLHAAASNEFWAIKIEMEME